MTLKKFVYRHDYHFIRDFVYDVGYPLPRVECHVGDIATFDGPGLAGSARFQVKQGETWALVIIKAKLAFKILEEP